MMTRPKDSREGHLRRPPPDLRLRVPTPGLLALPWQEPLEEWDSTDVPFRDLPVGPSRHLVRFVETGGRLWALKELPARVATKEYEVLRELETMSLPAVRAAGLVTRPDDDAAILVTRYLERSWQYRRLLMRIPQTMAKHRERLLDAMASLLVDLHRNGVFWGDCSLANTLFSRDGQVLQAWLVDAETSEIHPQLSDGQRRYDLEILVENVAGGMIDLAARLDEPSDSDAMVDLASSVGTRYEELWDALHAEPTFAFADRYQIEGQIRRLHELGFVVDEVILQPTGLGDETFRLKVGVADRQFHATQLRSLTGLDVGEGQARILLGDLRAYQGWLQREGRADVSEAVAGRRWVDEVLTPGMERAQEATGSLGGPVQSYCDLLEVRWLLSEEAGHDVGDEVALAALCRRSVPPESAARMAIAEAATEELGVLTPELLDHLALEADEAGDPY